MNHRKLIPANGMSLAARSILALPVSSHCEPGEPPSGSDVRIRISAAPNSRANSTPAKAAARGVVSALSVLERCSTTPPW